MALAPSAMMMLRRGPAMGPAATPGGAPGAGPPGAGMPATPGAESPGNILMTAIANRMNQEKKANANFGAAHLAQQMRVLSVMQVHYAESHPEVARHLNRAWASLDQANKALKEAMGEQSTGVGPPLGFSGAQMGPSEAGGGGPVGMGGGMGVPR